MSTKFQSSDAAGNSDTPKNSCNVLPLSEHVRAVNIRRKEKKKNWKAEISKIYGKNASPFWKTVKKEKKFVPVLLFYLDPQKLGPQCFLSASLR